MRAMLVDGPGGTLRGADLEPPVADDGQVRLRVRACGVCRTDLHVLDGDLAEATFPLVLGHQIVGEVDQVGARVDGLAVG